MAVAFIFVHLKLAPVKPTAVKKCWGCSVPLWSNFWGTRQTTFFSWQESKLMRVPGIPLVHTVCPFVPFFPFLPFVSVHRWAETGLASPELQVQPMEAKKRKEGFYMGNILLLSHPADRAVTASPQSERTSSTFNFYLSIPARVNFYQTNYICKLIMIMNIKDITNIKGIYMNIKPYILVVSNSRLYAK